TLVCVPERNEAEEPREHQHQRASQRYTAPPLQLRGEQGTWVGRSWAGGGTGALKLQAQHDKRRSDGVDQETGISKQQHEAGHSSSNSSFGAGTALGPHHILAS